MFLNVSDQWFFSRTKTILRKICQGSPSSCKDYSAFYEFFQVENFDDESTQSFVGILSYKKNPAIMAVFKISQEENNVIINEYEILRQLDHMASKCPHFVRVYGLVNYYSPVKIESIQKLEKFSPTLVDRKLLLLEYISGQGSLGDFIRNLSKAKFHILVSIIAQVLMSIKILRAKKITHNDLHCDNILIKTCAPNVVFKYVFRNKEILIPSFGYCAVLIDFGLGRSDITEEDMALTGNFNFIHYGFHPDAFNHPVDYIRFISSLRIFIGKDFPLLNKWCCRLLRPIKGINENGWDKFYSKSAVEQFSEKISKFFPGVKLFEDTLWIDNLQLLVNRPIQNMEVKDISTFGSFVKNWKKFEERISSIDELNYLFKYLISSIKIWRNDFLNQNEGAVESIKQNFLKNYENVVKFHCPKVNYEEIICSLILGASYLERFYYMYIQTLENKMPKRGGMLMKTCCDEEVWRDFFANFGKHLDETSGEDREFKNIYLWDI